MSSGAGKKQSRVDRERARLYQERAQFHESLGARRRRDNLIAGVAGGLLIVGIFAAQAVYFTAGPGAPAPSPSVTPTTPAPTSSPSDPSPSATPTPTP